MPTPRLRIQPKPKTNSTNLKNQFLWGPSNGAIAAHITRLTQETITEITRKADKYKISDFQSMLEIDPTSKATVDPKTKSTLFKRQPNGSGTKVIRNYHGRNSKRPYGLIAKYGANTIGKSGKLIYPNDYINKDLAEDLEGFKEFRCQNHNCSETTIRKDIQHFLLL